LAHDVVLVVVNAAASNIAATDTSILLDIGIGAAAAETVLIPNLLAGWASAVDPGGSPRHYIFPLYIPSGSRVSARSASARSASPVTVWLQMFGGLRRSEDWWCGEQVIAYGINTGVSQGTNVTPGASSAEGSWTAIGTTSQDHKMIVPGIQLADTNTNSTTSYTYDFGIDTTSTSLLRENYRAILDASERIAQMGVWWPINVPVASGSVLAARASSVGSTDTLDVALYGIS
jgi:hypothetical protein